MCNIKPSILVDLNFGHKINGFAGIPQETRLLFSGLHQAANLKVSGLIWGCQNWVGRHLNKLHLQSIFLGNHLHRKHYSLFPKLYRRMLTVGSNYNLYALMPELGAEMIWRSFFAATLPASERWRILAANFFLTSLGLARVIDGTLKRLPQVRLNTSKFDFVIFQDSKAITVSPGTQKIIRYHDGIPILASDTYLNDKLTKLHYQAILCCQKDSIYVCNSPSALSDLEKVSPRLAQKSRVIPCFIPKMEKAVPTLALLKAIVSARVAKSTLSYIDSQKQTVVNKWFNTPSGIDAMPCYIMSLATIEPRKNYIGLINAWLRLRHQINQDIKLMIVGSPGWCFKPSLKAMRPFVATGDLLHLERVAQHELPYLYSAASCFVFPSFIEGFGMPPIEAMQCGCPVILSDIPAHRYCANHAAIYCDPYDEKDIAAKIQSLIFSSKPFIENLRQKGYENAKRFSPNAVLPQWQALFDELKSHR